MKVTLRIGNYVNGGTIRGGAYGFKIDTFAKLKELRSNKPGFTLLHYLVTVIYEKYPDTANFVQEFAIFKDCLRYDIDSISKQLASLNGTFNKCKNFLPTAEKLVAQSDLFHPKFTEFEKKAGDVFTKARKEITNVNEKYETICVRFGEDPKQVKMNEFFQIWRDFANDFERAKADIDKQKALEAKLAKQEEARKNKNLQSKRGVLDNMMKELEEGVPVNRPKGAIAPPIASKNDLMAAMARVRRK